MAFTYFLNFTVIDYSTFILKEGYFYIDSTQVLQKGIIYY